MKHTSRNLLIVLVVVLVGIVAGAAYYFGYYFPQRALQAQNNEAMKAFSEGDYSTSIDNLRSLIANAPNKTEAGRLQVLLAAALYGRGQGSDVSDSISMLKKVVNDYSIAAWVRALALNNLASTALSNDVAFYKQNFSDAPYNSYLPEKGDDFSRVHTAYYNILKLSDETYPTSYAEYAIAGNYFAPMIANGEIKQSEMASTSALMQQYIQEGDSQNDIIFYNTSPSSYLFRFLYRAEGLHYSAKTLDNVSLTDQEEAYKSVLTAADTMEKAGRSVDSAISQAVLLRARFYYAIFLRSSYGNKRDDDIKALLQPFSQSNATMLPLVSLVNFKNLPDDNYLKENALAFAKISPDFKQFLEAQGVKI